MPGGDVGPYPNRGSEKFRATQQISAEEGLQPGVWVASQASASSLAVPPLEGKEAKRSGRPPKATPLHLQ